MQASDGAQSNSKPPEGVAEPQNTQESRQSKDLYGWFLERQKRAVRALNSLPPKPAPDTSKRDPNQPPPWLKYYKDDSDPLEGLGPPVGWTFRPPSVVWMALVDCIGPFSRNDLHRMGNTALMAIIAPVSAGAVGYMAAKRLWRWGRLRIGPFFHSLFKRNVNPSEVLPSVHYTPRKLIPRFLRERIRDRRIRKIRRLELRKAILERAELEMTPLGENPEGVRRHSTRLLRAVRATFNAIHSTSKLSRNVFKMLRPIRMRMSLHELMRGAFILGSFALGVNLGYSQLKAALDHTLKSFDDPYLRLALRILHTEGTSPLDTVYLLKKLVTVANYTKYNLYGHDDGFASAWMNEREKRKIDTETYLNALKKYLSPNKVFNVATQQPYYVPGKLKEFRAVAITEDPFQNWYIASGIPKRKPDKPEIQPVAVIRGLHPDAARLLRAYYMKYGTEEIGFSLDPHKVKLYDVHGPGLPMSEGYYQMDKERAEQERYIKVRKRQAFREWHGAWASIEEQEMKKRTPAADPQLAYRIITNQYHESMPPLSIYEKERLDDWRDMTSPTEIEIPDSRIDASLLPPEPRWDVIYSHPGTDLRQFADQRMPRYGEHVDLNMLWKGQEAAHPTPPLTRYSVNFVDKHLEDSPEGRALREKMRKARDPAEMAPNELSDYEHYAFDPRTGPNFVPHLAATGPNGELTEEDIARAYTQRYVARPRGVS